MTVIVVAVARLGEGIALAADGRVSQSETGAAHTMEEQKLFPFRTSAAFAIMGWAVCGEYNLVSIAKEILADMQPSLDFNAALGAFAKGVNRAITEAVQRGQVTFPVTGNQPDGSSGIARIIVVRESSKGATIATLRFRHRNQQVLEDVAPQFRDLNPGAMFCPTGSKVIGDHLYGKRGERKPINRESSLQDAINCVRDYVQAHVDPAAVKLDPTCRDFTGGVVYVASIRRGLFNWVQQPA